MFTNAKALVVIVSCALVVQAQSSGSSTTSTAPASQSSLPAGLDACILGCITQAAVTGNCSSYADLPCVCTSAAFQNAAVGCLQANCTAADLATAIQLQSSECAALSSGSVPASTAASTPASSGTSSTAAVTPASSGTSSTSVSASHSATSTSAAMALSAPWSFGSLVGTLVASAGALVGAAFVL